MMKRVLSIFIAVVIFTTAIVVFPKNNVVKGAGTNVTWDKSVHAMNDGDYPSHEMFTLTADEDEFSMPYKWHVTDFNHCDQDTIPGDSRPLYRERSETDFKIAVSIENAPAAIKNLPVSQHTQTAQAIRAEVVNSGNSNICTQVLNYNGAKLSDYQYLRFTVYLENVQLDPDPALQNSNNTKPYFLVQLYDDITKGSPFDRTLTATLNEKCKNDIAYDFVYDLTAASNLIETLHAVEFHFRTIQKIDKSKPGYVWYDNIRLVKNTTHTPYYASKVNVSKKVFNACDQGISSFKYVPNGSMAKGDNAAFVLDSNSGIDQSAGSLRIFPNKNKAWYQYSFTPDNSSETFKLSDFSYFRFYVSVRSKIPKGSKANTVQIESGKDWPNDYDTGSPKYPFTLWFSQHADYAGNVADADAYGFVQGNIRLNLIQSGGNGKGWYVCMVPISAISSQENFNFNKDVPIKSISIQLGYLQFGGVEEDYCVNIDQLEFISYTYSDDTRYAYRAGHYQILEDFEDTADAKLNVRSGADSSTYLAMRHDDVATSLYYKSNFGGWLHEYGKPSNTHYEDYYAAEYDDIVTQGLYADWIRANAGTYKGIHSGNLEAAYNIRSESGGSFDLSKFTNFSVDLTIRPQHQTLNEKTAPGLQGTEETFRIRVRTQQNHSYTSWMTFKLHLSSDYSGEGKTPFYSSSDGIEILPLDGFMPGRDGAYTCSGSMRITFTLADLLKNADPGFDITQVEQIRFEWLKSGVGTSGGTERSQDTYDNRYADFFLDNFVGFTPDMRITVKTEGVPESDANQSFVFNIKGGDEVSQHVDCKFTLQGNDTEEIYNLPFNSYTIQQTDWAWRFISDVPADMQKEVAQQMATVNSPTGKFTYKDIVENKVSLHHTVVFTPKKTDDKWLSDERRIHYTAKN